MVSTVPPRRARVVACMALALLLILPAAARAADQDAFAGAAMTGAAAQLAAAAAAPPAGFEETVALSGLTQPTAVRFAPDGRIFVAEKSGRIKVFDDFGDPTATVYADLSQQVHDFWDRGLLGLALDPQFTTGRPYVYVLYAYNKDPSSAQFPRWGDSCPTPPGATADGCVISGRLSRLNGGVEQVLIEDWCQQYPSHSTGSLAFGNDGALYVSGGDGASFNFADYGQDGSAAQPVRRPARRPRLDAHAADRRGRRAAQPGRAHAGRPDRSQRRDPAREPGHGRGHGRQPERRQPGPERPPHRRLRPAQPVPHHRPAGHQRGLVGRRRLERLGGDQPRPEPHRRGPQLRLALLRGHGPDAVLRQPEPQPLRDALRQGTGGPRGAVLHVQPLLARRDRARPAAPARRRSPASPSRRRPAASRTSTTARCSSPTTAATASGPCSPAPTGCRTRTTVRPSSPRRRTRSSSSSAPAATSTTSTSRAARSAACAR